MNATPDENSVVAGPGHDVEIDPIAFLVKTCDNLRQSSETDLEVEAIFREMLTLKEGMALGVIPAPEALRQLAISRSAVNANTARETISDE